MPQMTKDNMTEQSAPEMSWKENPTVDGLYWYVDADYWSPIEVTVRDMDSGDPSIDLEDDLVVGLNLLKANGDCPHFMGPIPPRHIPTVPPRIKKLLEDTLEDRS